MAFYLAGSNQVEVTNSELEISNDVGNAIPVSDTKSLNAGAADANTLRTVSASDSPEVAGIGAVADSAVTDPTASASIIAALKGIMTITPAQLTFAAETQLTAPGTTSTLDITNYSNAVVQFTVAAIDTSVDVRPEGSINGGTTWFSLLSNDVDRQLTANGEYAFVLSQDIVAPLNAIRFNFVAEAGGTAATIDVQVAVH